METLVNEIEKIQQTCKKHYHGCNGCRYLHDEVSCKVKDICYLLCRHPQDWDIKKIEEIAND